TPSCYDPVSAAIRLSRRCSAESRRRSWKRLSTKTFHSRYSSKSWIPPGTLELSTSHIGQGGAPLDLMLLMGEQDGELLCALQYNTDLFDYTTIERMAEHFTTLLRGIVADPGVGLSKLPIHTADERSRQTAWNDTEIRFEAQT